MEVEGNHSINCFFISITPSLLYKWLINILTRYPHTFCILLLHYKLQTKGFKMFHRTTLFVFAVLIAFTAAAAFEENEELREKRSPKIPKVFGSIGRGIKGIFEGGTIKASFDKNGRHLSGSVSAGTGQ